MRQATETLYISFKNIDEHESPLKVPLSLVQLRTFQKNLATTEMWREVDERKELRAPFTAGSEHARGPLPQESAWSSEQC